MAARAKKRKPVKRNGIAAALKFFTPKIVKSKKGKKAYRRKGKYASLAE
jgi:stalled ribosome alternative rescue factor ArfA